MTPEIELEQRERRARQRGEEREREIRELFTYHLPSSAGVERHALLSKIFEAVGKVIERSCPDGREKALVFTKLEEAKMWASAAVVLNPETR